MRLIHNHTYYSVTVVKFDALEKPFRRRQWLFSIERQHTQTNSKTYAEVQLL